MPLTPLHFLTGAATGSAFYALDRALTDKELDVEKLKDVALLGGLAGALPDILEPPLHRRHRSFFHSFVALGSSVAAFTKVDEDTSLNDEQKRTRKALLAAYLSHLLLDSRTPMGLPLVV